VDSDEYKFFKNMLAEARSLAKMGVRSAIIGSGCHTQGMYALAPNGTVLGMIHQWDRPQLYVAMMKLALERWEQLSRKERLLAKAPDPVKGRADNYPRADLYPEDGLVLKDSTRSLPYDPPTGLRYSKGASSHPDYNRLDFSWFRKDEARQFLPERIEVGARHDVPRKMFDRILLLNLGTNTDTLAGAFGHDTVKEARLTVTVKAIKDGRAELELEGTTWIWGPQDSAARKNSGYRAKLLGKAAYDLKAQRFVEFGLVALGIREFGGPEVPTNAPNPLPLGVLFTLAGNGPADRIPPGHLHRYGW
jgi:hypothetical protein